MRYIYPDDEDGEQGATIISDEAESLVDSIAASLMRSDSSYAYVRAQRAIEKAKEEGKQKGLQSAKDWAERENLMRAEFGKGKAEFITRDGLSCFDRLEQGRHEYYPPVWKRAEKPEPVAVLEANAFDMSKPIRIRSYEFTGIGQHGLPIYKEMSAQ